MRNIVICEDNHIQLSILETIVKQYFENKDENDYQIKCYLSGKEMIDDLIEGYLNAECILLDIEMPNLNGIETAKIIRTNKFNVPIVFITSHNDYAEQSYQVRASGYLTKPYDLKKITSVLDGILSDNDEKRILITVNRQKRYICIDDITYIESDRRDITIHLKDGVSYQFNGSMAKIEEQINRSKFLRCHQSFIVNMDYIEDFDEDFILKDKTRVPIRVKQRKDIHNQFIQYYSQKHK